MTDKKSHPTAASLSLYYDGEGAEELRRGIAEHVGDCPQCQEELDLLREISASFTEFPKQKAPRSVRAGVRESIRQPSVAAERTGPPRWVGGVAALSRACPRCIQLLIILLCR